ncbi:MAG: NUDIX hydrolase [Pseudonocardiaceae bacterium]
MPGGHVDSDEDPAVTAACEVVEETGWRPRESAVPGRRRRGHWGARRYQRGCPR